MIARFDTIPVLPVNKDLRPLCELLNDAYAVKAATCTKINATTARNYAAGARSFADNPGFFANTTVTYASVAGIFADDRGNHANAVGLFAYSAGIFANLRGTYASVEGFNADTSGTYANTAGIYANAPLNAAASAKHSGVLKNNSGRTNITGFIQKYFYLLLKTNF